MAILEMSLTFRKLNSSLFSILQDLVSTINGFDSLVKIPKIFDEFSSKLIQRLTQFAPKGDFPDFKVAITFFKVCFTFVVCMFNATLSEF